MGAVFLAALDIGLHALQLALRHHRPHLGTCVQTVPDLDLIATGDDVGDYLFEHFLVHVEPRAGRASLPGGKEDRIGGARRCEFQIGIRKDEHR